MFEKIKNSRGMSLIEILVSVAVMAGLALAGSAAFSSWSNSTRILDSRHEANLVIGNIRSALGTTVACTANLGGTVVNGGAVTPTTVIKITKPIALYNASGVKVLNSSGAPTYVFNTTGPISDSNSFVPTSLTLTPGPDVQINVATSTAEKLGQIQIADLRKTGPPQIRTAPVFLTYSTATNKVTSCIVGIDLASEIKQQVCVVASNGTSHWNAATQTCVLNVAAPPVTVFRSDNPYAYNCPSGFKLQNTSACTLTNPSPWTSPLPTISTTYDDGTTKPTLPAAGSCKPNVALTGCTCLYAKLVDPTNGGNYPNSTNLNSFFTVSVKCIPD